MSINEKNLREVLATVPQYSENSNNNENMVSLDANKDLQRLQQMEQMLLSRERELARREAEVQRMKAELDAEMKKQAKADKKPFKSEIAIEDLFPSLPRPRSIQNREIEMGPAIGTGKFAEVSMGFLRVPCAVKKMRGPSTQENLSNFRRETAIMNACNHPNVIKLLGYCSEGGKYCLIQELVTGGNLHERMHKKHCHLTYQQVVRVGLQVAEAMVHLHSLNIVHRDIKPHNFVIDNSFEPAKVLLCDFGLARMKNGKYVETDGRVAGTPAYQAPEMLRLQPITEKVDQYSFAILLWEMITCQLPWWGKTFEEMVNCVTRLDERPAIPSDCPEPLASVVRECWQPDPEQRPSFELVRQRMKIVNEMLKSMPEFRSKVGPHKTAATSGSNPAAGAVPASSSVPTPTSSSATNGIPSVLTNSKIAIQQAPVLTTSSAPVGFSTSGNSAPISVSRFSTGPNSSSSYHYSAPAPAPQPSFDPRGAPSYEIADYGGVNANSYAPSTSRSFPSSNGAAVYYL